MGLVSLTLPNVGDPNSTADPQIKAALQALVAAINGNLDSSNLTATIAAQLGISAGAVVSRGAVVIPGLDTTTSTSYTTLATPDKIPGLTMPATGFMVVAYQARWSTTLGTFPGAQAAIFLNSNQLQIAAGDGSAPKTTSAGLSTTGIGVPLSTYQLGLISSTSTFDTPNDVTTGQVFGFGAPPGGGLTEGGVCTIFAAPGDYDLSVQFKGPAGATIDVVDRRLYVWTIGF